MYLLLRIEDFDDISLLSANFSGVTLKYTVKDCDPNTGLPEDEG